MNTILLDDGFNGSKALFNTIPVAIDGNLLKLRCAEPGKEYMTAWKHKDEVAQAIQEQTSTHKPNQLTAGSDLSSVFSVSSNSFHLVIYEQHGLSRPRERD
jgi:hypothetical protein